jgi:hypothetical protein
MCSIGQHTAASQPAFAIYRQSASIASIESSPRQKTGSTKQAIAQLFDQYLTKKNSTPHFNLTISKDTF